MMEPFYQTQKQIDDQNPAFFFCGWAGEQSEIGPAYTIRRELISDAGIRLFYTDEDIERCERYACALAQKIAAESSGIADVHAECLHTDKNISGWDTDSAWHVLFRIDPNAVKEHVTVCGEKLFADESGGYVFVLPRAGEFLCYLGCLSDGKRTILHQRSFCMK